MVHLGSDGDGVRVTGLVTCIMATPFTRLLTGPNPSRSVEGTETYILQSIKFILLPIWNDIRSVTGSRSLYD